MDGWILTVLGLVAVVAFAIGFIVGAGLTIRLAFDFARAGQKDTNASSQA